MEAQMPEVNLNYVAVLVAAIVNMAVGAVWYSRQAFGNAWVKATGKKMEEMTGAGSSYAWVFGGSLIMAYVLAHFVDYAGADTFAKGLQTGFWSWLGFVLPTMGANATFEGKSLKLFSINAFYPLVSLMLMGAILAVWS